MCLVKKLTVDDALWFLYSEWWLCLVNILTVENVHRLKRIVNINILTVAIVHHLKVGTELGHTWEKIILDDFPEWRYLRELNGKASKKKKRPVVRQKRPNSLKRPTYLSVRIHFGAVKAGHAFFAPEVCVCQVSKETLDTSNKKKDQVMKAGHAFFAREVCLCQVSKETDLLMYQDLKRTLGVQRDLKHQ